MTVEERHALNSFVDDPTPKTFTNLQDVAQATLHAMKGRKPCRPSSPHDLGKHEPQSSTSLPSQFIGLDSLGLNARQFSSLGQPIDFDGLKHSTGLSARQPFNLDQPTDFDGLRHSIDLNSLHTRTRQSFADLFGARQPSNLDRPIDFDSPKHPIDLDDTRRSSADLLSARQPSSLSQSTDFVPPLRRSSKRHRSTEIINSVKRQVVQSSVLEEADTFLTASARLIGFLYSRVVTQEARQECDAFFMAYDRFLNAMDKDEHDGLF